MARAQRPMLDRRILCLCFSILNLNLRLPLLTEQLPTFQLVSTVFPSFPFEPNAAPLRTAPDNDLVDVDREKSCLFFIAYVFIVISTW